jgi:hypothetical protein
VTRWRQDGEARRADLLAELSRRLDRLVPLLVGEVLRRAEPTELVLRYVDLDRAVSAVDLDAAAARLDVQKVLGRLDLTAVVTEQVDLDVVVEAVLDRLDLVGLAAEVIDGVDLPEIIRESTGSMASETVRGVRMQGIAADDAVGRAVDRLLLRRGHRSTAAPAPPSAPATSSAAPFVAHHQPTE